MSESKIEIDAATFTKLIQDNGNLVRISKKEAHISENTIKSLEELELLLH